MISKQNLILLSLCMLYVVFGQNKQLRADDEPKKVVCFGDSITKRGYPDLLGKLIEVDTINAGVAGHTSREGLRRIKKDVLAHNPDVVVVFFGTNDIRVDAPKKYVELDEYKSNLKKIISDCQAQNSKVVLCTLPPIEQDAYFARHEKKLYDDHGGLEQLVQTYREAAVQIAQQTEIPLVDLNKLLQNDPEWLSKDGVHPSKKGSRLIAKHISAKVAPLLGNDADQTEPEEQAE